MSFVPKCLVGVLGVLALSCSSRGAPGDDPASSLGEGRASLRAAYVAAVQAHADDTYSVRLEAGAYVAENGLQGLTASLDERGVSIARRGGSTAALTLRTVAFGCEGATSPVRAAVPAAKQNRVTYHRGEIVEWWLNGPLGVEQGFDVAEAPDCAKGGAALSVEVELGGASEPSLDAASTEVTLRAEDGSILRMTDAHAFDASGRDLPVRFDLKGRTLSLVVDAEGADYPVVIDPVIMTQNQIVTASDAPTHDDFGQSVAMQGSRAVLAAKGAAYVFDRVGNLWTETALIPATGFGNAIALDGNTFALGSPTQVSVYVESGGVWSLQQTIISGNTQGYHFPNTLALNGNTMAVGALFNNAVDIWVRAGTVWSKQQTLTLPFSYPYTLGTSLAIEGNTLIAGSPEEVIPGGGRGYAYVYNRTGTTWTKVQTLQGNTSSLNFGHSAAISLGTLIIGAPYGGPTQGGEAFVYVKSGSTFTLQQTLVAAGTSTLSAVGTDVAIDGDVAVATTSGASYQLNPAAYLFYRQAGVWYEAVKLQGTVPGAGYFGRSAAVSGNTVLISRPGDIYTGGWPGSAYFYDVDPNLFLGCLSAPDGTPCDDGTYCTVGDTCQAGACAGTIIDSDGDGVADCVDNCPSAYNPSQLDLDHNYFGEACVAACLPVVRGGAHGSVADAAIAQSQPSKNNGALSLRTGSLGGLPVQALVRFDLSFLPSVALVQYAGLSFGAKSITAGTSLHLHEVTAPWNESTVTWNSFAGASNPAVALSFVAALGKNAVDATTLTQAWIDGSSVNNGLLLDQPVGSTDLVSSEGLPLDGRPILIVCYAAPGY